jgi:hypothetical protein
MVRLLIWIPIVFGLCILTTFGVFMISALLKPDTGYVLFTFVWEALSAFMEMMLNGTPEAAAHMTISSVLWVLLTLFVIPIGLTIIVCETYALRSFVLQSGMTGFLTLFLPLAAMEVRRPLELQEQHVSILLFLAGCAAGAMYWLLAGRHAGGRDKNIPKSAILGTPNT